MQPPAAVLPRPPPPKPAPEAKSLKFWVAMAVCAALGAVGGYLGMKFGVRLGAEAQHGSGSPWSGLLPLLALPAAWLLSVAAHEFGHLAGGWAGGGQFLLYVVGPFKWQRTPEGVRFSWNGSVNLGGGLAACLPLDATRVTPRRVAVMIAGGPLASLLVAGAALGLASVLAGPSAAGLARGLTQGLLGSVGWMSLLIFGLTVFPSTMGGFKSDGRRFFELLRGDRRSDQEKAMLALTTAGLAGVRPADLDPGLVSESLALQDGSVFDLYAHFTAYLHAIDRGEVAQAQARLDYVIAGEARLVSFIRDAARCEYAWLLATRADAPGAARAWLDSAGPLAFDPATRLRAEAAVLLAEGRLTEAATKAREGLHALKHKSMSPVESPFAREALEAVIRQAEPGAGPQI